MRHKLISFLLIAATLIMSKGGLAAPSQPTVGSGTLSNGGSVVITGSNFLTHPDYHVQGSGKLPYLWAQFENGFTEDALVKNDAPSYWTRTTAGGRSGYAVRRAFGSNAPGLQTLHDTFSTGVFYQSTWMYVTSGANGKAVRYRFNQETVDYWLNTGGGNIGCDTCSTPTFWGVLSEVPKDTWFRMDMLLTSNSQKFYIVGMNSNNPIHEDTRSDVVANHDVEINLGAGHEGSGYYGFDDVFANFTQARVELCDKSIWSARTHCEVQVPSVWSGTSITAKVNTGSFSANSTAYLYVIDSTGAVSPASAPLTIGGQMANTEPSLSNGAPSGTQAYGTTQVTMSVNTNENATCKWSSTPGVAYGSIPTANVFTTSGGMYHSTLATGLTNGTSYTRYIRCIDTEGLANSTDYPISWSVAAAPQDQQAPTVITGSPSGVQAYGTTQVTMRATTDEVAICKYSSSPGVAYSSMTGSFTSTNSTSHSVVISGLANGTSYTRYVKCIDSVGNPASVDFPISWSISGTPTDTTEPYRSNGSPSGPLAYGTTSVTMALDTDEVATCKWSSTAGVAYSSMTNTFTNTNNMSHSTTLSGLTGGSYTRYVRCSNTAGIQNATDYIISWTIASSPADQAEPVRSNGLPTGNLAAGTASVDMRITTNEQAICRWAPVPGVAYASMPNIFSTTNSTGHSTPLAGLQNGVEYLRYVKCIDLAGNANQGDYIIRWRVSTPAGGTGKRPVKHGGQYLRYLSRPVSYN